MSFNFFSTRVKVSFLFMAMLCVLLICDRTGYAFPMLCAACFHEVGHFIAMYVCRCTPTEINLLPGAVQICTPPASLKHELFILVCGPLFNLLIFTVLFVNCYIFSNVFLLEFAIINLIYGIFNMLPFKGLDGSGVLECLLVKQRGYETAKKTINIITIVASVLVFIVATIMSLKGTVNYSAYIMGLYLILSVLLKF